MAKPFTKNIRIKKPGGGTRLQKVRVLASGKFKFMKNDKTARKSSTKVTRLRASSKSKGGKTVARRRRRAAKKARAKAKTTIPVGLLVPGGAGTLSTAKDMWDTWVINRGPGTGGRNVLRVALLRTTGIDIFKKSGEAGRWDPLEAHFTLGWGVGALLHKFVGTKLGVNKALGQARVPWLRV